MWSAKSTGWQITSILRAAYYADYRAMLSSRKRKAREKYENNVRKKAKKAACDHAEEINCNSLVTDVGAFQTQLAARENSLKAKVIFLKEQFHARVSGDEPRVYTSLGPEFRTKHGKLRLTAQNKSITEVAYLHPF
jgi:hypothetical protein